MILPMRTLSDLPTLLSGKRVLVRADFDTPLINGKIADETRIEQVYPTVQELLGRKAVVILLSHLDRPGGKVVESLRLNPIAEVIKKRHPQLKKINQSIGPVSFAAAKELNDTEILLLENLRFYSGEEDNEVGFTRELARLGHYYVNDAFATSHRTHASIVALPKILPHAAGLRLEIEVNALEKLKKPEKPFIAVIGGVKLKTKLVPIEALAKKADKILVGGKLAASLGDVCSPEAMACIEVADLTEPGKEITIESARNFASEVSRAKTILFNGPLGLYEEGFEEGTRLVVEAIYQTSAYRVAGGGDTEAALTKLGLLSAFDHISSGGGAMLEYVAYGKLPGIEALK